MSAAKLFLCSALMLLLTLPALTAPAVPAVSLKSKRVTVTESTNRILLLKPNATTTLDDVDRIARSHGLEKLSQPKKLRWRHFSVPPGKSKSDTITALKQSGLFEHIVEPKTYTTQEIPNDPMFDQLWGMTNISAHLAWDKIREVPDVVVAVVDTGIDFDHPDLADNLWTGPNGEHGYVATNGVVLPGGIDDHGHGTHVSGTIGAVGNNSIGVVGVAWRIRIMAIKVLHHGSGTSIDIVNGYEKMVELKESGVPILISNHSYGGSGQDQYMKDGFRLLDEADIFAAVAAGNSAQDIDSNPFHPASFSFNNMVVAIASDRFGKQAGFSNFGIVGADIAAPGVDVLSTTRNNTYSSFSGTSMAAPHIAGLATLVRQLNPGLTASQTREVILHPGSYDPDNFISSTFGKINAAKTVSNPKIFENPFITNNPPVITNVTPYTVINGQSPAIIQASGFDPDGDQIRWNSSLNGLQPLLTRRLLALNGVVVSNIENTTIVSGGPVAYQIGSELAIGASDQKGGSVLTNSGFEFARNTQVRRSIPVKTWAAAPNPASSNLLSVTFDVDDPAKSNYLFLIAFNFPGWLSSSYCCNTPSPTPLQFTSGRASNDFSVRVFCMDKWFNYVTTETINYRSSGVVTNIPKLVVTVSTNEGNAPFDVVFDMRNSELAEHYAVFNLFAGSYSSNQPVQNVSFKNVGIYFTTPMVLNLSTLELDYTIIPVIASRFLDQGPPPKIANINIQKANDPEGPWVTFTNFVDVIKADTYYRVEGLKPQ